ncbi:MAG: response regulator transcription factor [Pseudomonadota bacterium]
MAIRILLVDDHALVCVGMQSLLADQADVEVVGIASTGHEAVRLTGQLNPDLVIMDVTMPDLNGIEATRQVLAESAGVRVLALSMHREDRYVLGMIRAGAAGYLVKDCSFDELMNAVRTVAAGRTFLSPAVAEVVIKGFRNAVDQAPGASALDVLSTREREVVQMLAEGASTKQVAERLFVNVKTVEAHRRNAMEKLNLDSFADLVKFALREGITSLQV